MKTHVLFVERKPSHFVSIEKVFRQVARALPPEDFDAEFQQVPYSNDLVSILKNLAFFRPRKAGIYHITGHIHYISFLLPRERTVLTIHDLAFLHTRKGLRRYMLKKVLLDWPLRRLQYVTVVSQFTKDEILKYSGVDESRIRVIENPLGSHLVPRERAAFNAASPTILQIGTMENKNIPRLVRAIDGLPCKLKIVGPLDDNIRRAIAGTQVEVENVEGLDDVGMANEYQKADIVAFCSTYEGFGLPVIEAQAMMAPVLTSDISPLKEVAGGAALLVDPTDPADIRKGIERLITDNQLRDDLVRRGTENVKRFEAAAIAEKYADLYREMLANV
jgi:glycosyltransferase involved in cell wall biosynthesis